jgi:hypothetical protein
MLFAAVSWWWIPSLVLSFPRDGELGLPAVFLGAIIVGIALCVCFRFRHSPWSFVVWLPLIVLTAVATGAFWLGAASIRLGGAGAAPLEGVFALICLALAIVATGTLVLCALARPRVYSRWAMGIGFVNLGVIAVATWQADEHAGREIVLVHVLDPRGVPLREASIRYEVYGYGSGGTRPHSPARRGGPVLSDANGVVQIEARAMRHEVEAVVSKPEYRDLAFNLGMQFDRWWQNRSLRLMVPSSRRSVMASVPCKKPITFSVYLSPKSEIPSALVYTTASAVLTGAGPYKGFLNVESGQFSGDESGDLEFEVVLEREGRRARPKLTVTGRNGAEVQLVPHAISVSGNLSPYEHVYGIAPVNDYVSSIVVPVGSSPGPTVYVRARAGALFARMELDARNPADDVVHISANIALNPTGSRSLEAVWDGRERKTTKIAIRTSAP